MSSKKPQNIDGGCSKPDRRSRQRYPLRMPLSGIVLRNGGSTIHGETLDISSQGILFATDAPLPINTWIDLRLQWPVSVGNLESIELHVFATVVRTTERCVAARIWNHSFRAIPALQEKAFTARG